MCSLAEKDIYAAVREVYDHEGIHIEEKDIKGFFSDITKLSWKDVYKKIYETIVVH